MLSFESEFWVFSELFLKTLKSLTTFSFLTLPFLNTNQAQSVYTYKLISEYSKENSKKSTTKDCPRDKAIDWAEELGSNENRYQELVNCLTLIYNFNFFERIEGKKKMIPENLSFKLVLNQKFIPQNAKKGRFQKWI